MTKKSFEEVWEDLKEKNKEAIIIKDKNNPDVEIMYSGDMKGMAISCPASFFQEWKKRFKSC